MGFTVNATGLVLGQIIPILGHLEPFVKLLLGTVSSLVGDIKAGKSAHIGQVSNLTNAAMFFTLVEGIVDSRGWVMGCYDDVMALN